MTKTVRVENADSNMSKQVVVEIWEQSVIDGVKTNKLIKTDNLTYPTTLFSYTLHDSNYLVIKEEDVEVRR